MNDGTIEKKYDTNPLDKKVADRAEAEMERDADVDTEGPTRPMSPETLDAAQLDTSPSRGPTSPNMPGPHSPPPSPPLGAPTHGRYAPPASYMPPRDEYATWAPPPAGPMQPRGVTSPHTGFQLKGSAQHGIKPNFAAMSCYLPFAGIITSVVLSQYEPPENHFVRFHAKQGIYAHAAFWAILIAFNIAKAAAPSAIDAILLLPQAIFYLASIAGFVYMMISAYKWETVQIPIIGEQVE